MAERTHDVLLTGLAYGGEAIGRLPAQDGAPARVVFVPFGIPGERVRVRIVDGRRGFARAQLVEVIEPSPERITPRCKHFGACGGCHYQHMTYARQLAAKTEILRDQLRRIGHIEQPNVQPAVASPEPWYYRNHVQFHVAQDGRLGYIAHPLPAPGMQQLVVPAAGATELNVLPITECHLPEEAINHTWPQLELEPDPVIERVSIRQGADEELLVMLESGEPAIPELEMEAGLSLVHVYEDDAVVLAGRGQISMRVLGREFRVSAQSFFQVNTAMAEKMIEHVLAGLPERLDTVLDLYCGAGLFSAFLAPRCQRLAGIESSPSACEDFAANLDEFDNVALYEDLAERVLPALQAEPQLVVADPPRAGLAPAVIDGWRPPSSTD